MSKNDDNEIEVDAESSDETLGSESEATPEEEVIPEDKPERKKVAALRARHALEDYFESKKIKEALDYLEEEENKKKKRLKKKE